jgi:hypothetical protein
LPHHQLPDLPLLPQLHQSLHPHLLLVPLLPNLLLPHLVSLNPDPPLFLPLVSLNLELSLVCPNQLPHLVSLNPEPPHHLPQLSASLHLPLNLILQVIQTQQEDQSPFHLEPPWLLHLELQV